MQKAFWLYYDLKSRPPGMEEKRRGDPDESESTDEENMGNPPSASLQGGSIQKYTLDEKTLVAMKNYAEKDKMYDNFVEFVFQVFDPSQISALSREAARHDLDRMLRAFQVQV